MKNTDLQLAVMIGSVRKERTSINPATTIINLLKERGIEPMVLDLQELNLPLFDDGLESEGRTKLLETYKQMDGLILVSPEYNHSISSATKNAIDYARSKELFDKPMSLVTVSAGMGGGARSIYSVRQAWFGVGGQPVRPFLAAPKAGDMDPANPDADWVERANGFLDESLRWFRIIKTGMEAEK